MQKAVNTKRKKRILIKLAIIIIIITLCLVTLFGYFKSNILPVVLTMSEATIKEKAINAINSAANIVLDETMKYDELVNVIKDNEGKISMIQCNTVKINRLARDLANISQKNIELIDDQTISLPIGAFTGSVIMSGVGPQINIKLMPIGAVTCDFISSFEEVGINQTKHSIYININTTISLVLPVSSVPVNTKTTILVCESIIVGKVPDSYFVTQGSENIIDLIPYA